MNRELSKRKKVVSVVRGCSFLLGSLYGLAFLMVGVLAVKAGGHMIIDKELFSGMPQEKVIMCYSVITVTLLGLGAFKIASLDVFEEKIIAEIGAEVEGVTPDFAECLNCEELVALNDSFCKYCGTQQLELDEGE